MKAREAPTPQEIAGAELERLQAQVNSLREAFKAPKPTASWPRVLEFLEGSEVNLRWALKQVEDNSAEALKGLLR